MTSEYTISEKLFLTLTLLAFAILSGLIAYAITTRVISELFL